MLATSLDVVRPLTFDRDLLDDLEPAVAEDLAHRVLAHRLRLGVGPWQAPVRIAEPEHLGLLVIDGLLARTVRLAGRRCAELLGPGDLLRPWEEDLEGSAESSCDWEVIDPAILADLDGRVAAQLARFPAVISRLLARSTLRSRSLAHQAAIARSRRADTRILLLMWHLADRWGRVTPTGVRIPVPLTHRLISELTCLARPTVSSTLGALSADGRLSREPDGGWLLTGDPSGFADG